jgi:hypothetical protein
VHAGVGWLAARVFYRGARFYITAVKKNERPRFVGTHDPTADKFGFTWMRVVGAPYIRLDYTCMRTKAYLTAESWLMVHRAWYLARNGNGLGRNADGS